MYKVGIIQESPVFLDKNKTIQKVISLVEKAAKSEAKLIVFPETFIPGYPDWMWRLRPQNDQDLTDEIHAKLLSNSVNLKTNDLDSICESARKNDVTIVCNINELSLIHI